MDFDGAHSKVIERERKEGKKNAANWGGGGSHGAASPQWLLTGVAQTINTALQLDWKFAGEEDHVNSRVDLDLSWPDDGSMGRVRPGADLERKRGGESRCGPLMMNEWTGALRACSLAKGADWQLSTVPALASAKKKVSICPWWLSKSSLFQRRLAFSLEDVCYYVLALEQIPLFSGSDIWSHPGGLHTLLLLVSPCCIAQSSKGAGYNK